MGRLPIFADNVTFASPQCIRAIRAFHVQNIQEKLRVHSTSAVVARALRENLLDLMLACPWRNCRRDIYPSL